MSDKRKVHQPPRTTLADHLKRLNALSGVAEFVFVLAAFDKDEDLGPGGKNLSIYSAACSEITSLLPDGPPISLVMQGEFLDLDQREGFRLAKFATKKYPVGSLPFNPEEFVDHLQFINAVHRPVDGAERILSAKIRPIAAELHGGSEERALGEARKYPANAAAWINRCVADPMLFAEFARLPGFALPPLVRPSAGAFGLEIHKLPDPARYEGEGLAGPYQRACVNRAIFDAVYPTALRPTRYVNTQHIADAIPRIDPGAVVVCYGFFPHSERVHRTVAAALWNRGLEIPAERLIERPVYGEWVPGAQKWCTSLEVFNEYTLRAAFR